MYRHGGKFYDLWVRSEDDLFGSSRNGYRLLNTGQGLQRCQGAPNVSGMMSQVRLHHLATPLNKPVHTFIIGFIIAVTLYGFYA